MSSKRQATSNLNHDNWDQEEEPEERGTFKTATQEELNLRVIKKARRKVAGKDDAAGETKNAFSGFLGFGKPATPSSSPYAFLAKLPTSTTTEVGASSTSVSTFSFLSGENANQKDEPKSTPLTTFSFGAKKEATSTTSSIFGKKDSEPGKSISTSASVSPSATATPDSAVSTSMFKASVPVENTPAVAEPLNKNHVSSEYRENVADLNREVTKFIKDNVDKNPYCILTPVFDNYNKHLQNLKDEEAIRSGKQNSTSGSSVTAGVTPNMPLAGFSFGKPTIPISGSSGGSSPGLLFGKKPNCTITSGTTTTIATKPLFVFGQTQAGTSTTSTTVGSTTNSTPTSAATSSIFGFTPSATTTTSSADAPKAGFFSLSRKDDLAPKTNGFSIGDNKPSTSGFTGFGKPATEGAPATGSSFFTKPPDAPQSTATTADNEEEDTPPKVEFKQVVEDDAVYSKRCKVYVKKDKDFADRGVGTLYLKPVKDSVKTQLLVRADTNLGNIIVNLILGKGLPVERMGKNNVMMVCVPTPEESKASTMLLRVKTDSDADELLDEIKKHTI